MLGFDSRAARYTWTAVLVVLMLQVTYLLRNTLFVFVLSLLFAYLLSPLVDLLDRLLPTRTRTPALALVYLLFVGLLVLVGFQLGTRVVDQANTLAKQLPDLLNKWQHPGPASASASGLGLLQEQALVRVQAQLRESSAHLLSSLPQAGLKFLSLASYAVYVFIIPVLSFFFLKDARELRQHFLASVEDGPGRVLLQEVMADVHLLLAHYMRALVILSAATCTAYSIFLLIMGVPYTVLLAVMAAMLEFLPMIGPVAAVVLIVIVAAVSGVTVWPVLLFLVLYRMFQDYALSPYIMGAGVEMHPLLVLFGVFAGAEIAGIAGAFLSVPVLALLRIVYRRFRRAHAAAAAADLTSAHP